MARHCTRKAPARRNPISWGIFWLFEEPKKFMQKASDDRQQNSERTKHRQRSLHWGRSRRRGIRIIIRNLPRAVPPAKSTGERGSVAPLTRWPEVKALPA
jgi:hypothetical protein